MKTAYEAALARHSAKPYATEPSRVIYEDDRIVQHLVNTRHGVTVRQFNKPKPGQLRAVLVLKPQPIK